MDTSSFGTPPSVCGRCGDVVDPGRAFRIDRWHYCVACVERVGGAEFAAWFHRWEQSPLQCRWGMPAVWRYWLTYLAIFVVACGVASPMGFVVGWDRLGLAYVLVLALVTLVSLSVTRSSLTLRVQQEETTLVKWQWLERDSVHSLAGLREVSVRRGPGQQQLWLVSEKIEFFRDGRFSIWLPRQDALLLGAFLRLRLGDDQVDIKS